LKLVFGQSTVKKKLADWMRPRVALLQSMLEISD
jgi:hypothetical protein